MEVDEFYVMGGAQADRGAGLRHASPSGPWTRSSARATPGSRPPSSRCWTAAPSTCRPGRPRSWSWPTTPPTRSTWPPTSSARPSTAPTPLPCWSRPRSALADAVEAELARQLPTLAAPRDPGGLPGCGRHGRAHGRRRRGPRLRRRVRARAPLRAWSRISMPRSRRSATPARCSWVPTRPSRPATTRLAPTTSCRRRCRRAPTARLGVESFGRWMQVNRITRDGLACIPPAVAVVAEAEGLTAHRRAVEIRFEGTA